MLEFYKNKRVLITGHTGFKGSWLAIWLHQMGAQVIGFAQDAYSEKDNFVLSKIGEKIIDLRGDIRDINQIKDAFEKYQPEIVFHLAAQSLVRQSYKYATETYETNVMGSINLMEAFRACRAAKVAVMITSDKCYENKEQLTPYKEDDAMGGYDPYSSSKGAAEIAISSWRRSFMNPKDYGKHSKSIASARAGNVIGGGDWTKDRIIPDCIRAIEANAAIEIRNPKAIRPWQHVLEPLSGYLLLAQKMWENPVDYCEGWNFGPVTNSIANVWEIANQIVSNYGKGELKNIKTNDNLHEAQLLTLDIKKAQSRLNWNPRLSLKETVEFTVEWYKKYQTLNVYDLCVNQILKYSKK
ncbi:MAG: CDP-glucose 4,6-dehydratase [Prevotellaceae bacterium]|jgi:CDP-glucose 4,6-dehydratase|nr:CDP-glucose 4,6-dehydratase [Prevotellaceae bacterium]